MVPGPQTLTLSCAMVRWLNCRCQITKPLFCASVALRTSGLSNKYLNHLLVVPLQLVMLTVEFQAMHPVRWLWSTAVPEWAQWYSTSVGSQGLLHQAQVLCVWRVGGGIQTPPRWCAGWFQRQCQQVENIELLFSLGLTPPALSYNCVLRCSNGAIPVDRGCRVTSYHWKTYHVRFASVQSLSYTNCVHLDSNSVLNVNQVTVKFYSKRKGKLTMYVCRPFHLQLVINPSSQ